MEMTESQTKTAQTCFNMFKKWIERENPEKKTISHYVKACIDGYPRGTKINPAILKSRVKGLQNFAAANPKAFKLNEKDVQMSEKLITSYRTKIKEEKALKPVASNDQN